MIADVQSLPDQILRHDSLLLEVEKHKEQWEEGERESFREMCFADNVLYLFKVSNERQDPGQWP